MISNFPRLFTWLILEIYGNVVPTWGRETLCTLALLLKGNPIHQPQETQQMLGLGPELLHNQSS
jgi:hypothetical protein